MSLAAWLPSDPFFVCLETVSSQFYPSKISCCFIIISATSFPSMEKLGLLSHRVLVSVIFLKKNFFWLDCRKWRCTSNLLIDLLFRWGLCLLLLPVRSSFSTPCSEQYAEHFPAWFLSRSILLGAKVVWRPATFGPTFCDSLSFSVVWYHRFFSILIPGVWITWPSHGFCCAVCYALILMGKGRPERRAWLGWWASLASSPPPQAVTLGACRLTCHVWKKANRPAVTQDPGV